MDGFSFRVDLLATRNAIPSKLDGFSFGVGPQGAVSDGFAFGVGPTTTRNANPSEPDDSPVRAEVGHHLSPDNLPKRTHRTCCVQKGRPGSQIASKTYQSARNAPITEHGP